MRALARDLSCSVITTRRAYEDLEGEGFIWTRQGMGTLVAEMPEEKMAAHRREAVDGAFREAVRACMSRRKRALASCGSRAVILSRARSK